MVDMEPVAERCSVVILGNWNVAIFQPPWVADRIFKGEVALHISFGPPAGMVSKYTRDDVALTVSATQLQLALEKVNDEVLARVESLARTILLALPETPVAAFGINFGYDLPSVPKSLETVLAVPDMFLGADAMRPIEEVAARFRIREDGDSVVNVTFVRSVPDGRITADFNYHYDIPSANAVRQRLEGLVSKRHEASLLDANGLLSIASSGSVI